MPAASDTRRQFQDLFVVYEWLLIAVAVVVWTLVLYAVVRYRRRDSRPVAARSEHKVVETLYAIALASIAVVLVTLTFRTESRVDATAATGGIRVDAVAFQWQWRFDYPASGKRVLGTSARLPTLVVPVDTVVHFDLSSRDVIHSFWIPQERFKRDAFPKRHTRFDLTFDHVGTLLGHCAEFCGLHHADMRFRVRIVPKSEFQRFAAAAK